MAGLSTSPEVLKNIATQLYKYQDFKVSAWKERVNITDYSLTTLQTYFSGMRAYISTGVADTNRAPRKFYDFVKECMETHVAKLTPSEKDRVRLYTVKPRKSGKVKVVQKATPKSTVNDPRKIEIKPETMEAIMKQPEKVHTVGLILHDNEDTIIRVFDNEDVLKGFVKAFQYMDKNNELTFEIVDITYSRRV